MINLKTYGLFVIFVVLMIYFVTITTITNATGFGDFPSRDRSLTLNEGGIIYLTMKRIKLTKGQYALVDDEDYDHLSQWKWHAKGGGSSFYAIRTVQEKGKKYNMFMHQQLLGSKEGLVIDHKDRNGLNNQRENLRHCTKSQNGANRVADKGSSSRHSGVCWCNHRKMWRAYISCNGIRKSLCYSESEMKCAILYNIAAEISFGEFARLNTFDETGEDEIEKMYLQVRKKYTHKLKELTNLKSTPSSNKKIMSTEEQKALTLSNEAIVNMLGDTISKMRMQLDEFKAKKGLSDSSNVLKQRKEIISILLEVYYYVSNDVNNENLSARKRIREFAELVEESVLDNGKMPTELMSVQAQRFDELWMTIRELNEETKRIAERRKIII